LIASISCLIFVSDPQNDWSDPEAISPDAQRRSGVTSRLDDLRYRRAVAGAAAAGENKVHLVLVSKD
jgi:hypothetical protein